MKTKFSNVVNIRNLPEYHPRQTDVQEIELFDIVVLTYDLPEHNLWRGQVGTVVEILANGDAFEVEFSDRDGRTYESLGFHASQLMVLHHQPRQKPLTKTINKVQKTTTTPNEKRLCQFKQLYPECLTEGKIDLEKLRNILSTEDIQENGNERYRFTWAGKSDAIRLLNTPTEATLNPCRHESHHFDISSNLFIEGDNLEVLKLLYKPYFGRVKAIYIDPPYNTGGDFVYPDNYTKPLDTYLELTGQIDAEGNLQTSNPETSGRYHSAWLSMMYPRLFLARQLLTEDGIIFISIDDHEVYNLRLMMNEIFGEENYIQQLVWQRHGGAGNKAKYRAIDHEYILVYAKHLQMIDNLRRPLTAEEETEYTEKDEYYPRLGPYKPRGFDIGGYGGYKYEIECPDGSKILKEWPWREERFLQGKKDNKIIFTQDGNGRWQVAYKLYRDESRRVLRSLLTDVEKNVQGKKQLQDDIKERDTFDYPKPVGLIKHLLQFSADSNSIVLDFFAGSCTTARAVMELNQEDNGNRQFIMVQFPEPTPKNSAARKAGFKTIADIGKERIRRVCQNLQESNGHQNGFRVFKLAASNYQTESELENDNPQIYINQLIETLDPLREGWLMEDVLYEVALKEGYPLDSKIAQVEDLATNTIFHITAPDGGQAFHVCLDAELVETDMESLALSKDAVFICRDVALDDTLAANLALQCRLKTI